MGPASRHHLVLRLLEREIVYLRCLEIFFGTCDVVGYMWVRMSGAGLQSGYIYVRSLQVSRIRMAMTDDSDLAL